MARVILSPSAAWLESRGNHVNARKRSDCVRIVRSACGVVQGLANAKQQSDFKEQSQATVNQVQAAAAECKKEMQSPELDPIRNKVELSRDPSSLETAPPFEIASSDTFPTDAERSAIAKWAKIRDACSAREFVTCCAVIRQCCAGHAMATTSGIRTRGRCPSESTRSIPLSTKANLRRVRSEEIRDSSRHDCRREAVSSSDASSRPTAPASRAATSATGVPNSDQCLVGLHPGGGGPTTPDGAR